MYKNFPLKKKTNKQKHKQKQLTEQTDRFYWESSFEKNILYICQLKFITPNCKNL